MEPDIFLDKFGEVTEEKNFNLTDEADKAELLQECMEHTCDKMLKKTSIRRNKKYNNYWWNETIAKLRVQMHKAQRAITRTRKKNGTSEALINAYNGLRRRLKKEITNSKKRAWTEFCVILEKEPWGKPYRAVMNRCDNKMPPNDMPLDKVKNILKTLFIIGRRPESNEVEVIEREDITYDITLDEEDVKYAIKKINEKKAVGVDGIPGDIVNLLVMYRTGMITRVINNITETGRIPECWKTARVILLHKPGKDPKLPNAYRPISILPALTW